MQRYKVLAAKRIYTLLHAMETKKQTLNKKKKAFRVCAVLKSGGFLKGIKRNETLTFIYFLLYTFKGYVYH